MDYVKYSRRGGFVLHSCLCFCLIACFMVEFGAAIVLLVENNETSLSFEDVEANFAPSVKGSGVKGVIYAAEPLDACTQFTNKAVAGSVPSFALIIRGGCTFDEKVQNAQDAGYEGAIVYNNEDSGVLISMAGTLSGIHIYAVFVSKASGELLKKYSGRTDVEAWIIPTFENSAWSVMAVSFISLLAMSAVLATCLFVRRHHIRQERPRNSQIREFHGMSFRLVEAMRSLVFTGVQDERGTSEKCAICQYDYLSEEMLRELPCGHQFHMGCVDIWLTKERAWCPVCKRDARVGASVPPPSEFTHLLASDSQPTIQSPAQRSFHRRTASPQPIARHASRQSVTHSFSGSPQSTKTIASHTNSLLRPASLLGCSGRLSFLTRCGNSGPSLCTMVPSQSPQQSQLQLCVDREHDLAAVRSTLSFRQSPLRNRSDSETSASVASAQSLPEVSNTDRF